MIKQKYKSILTPNNINKAKFKIYYTFHRYYAKIEFN